MTQILHQSLFFEFFYTLFTIIIEKPVKAQMPRQVLLQGAMVKYISLIGLRMVQNEDRKMSRTKARKSIIRNALKKQFKKHGVELIGGELEEAHLLTRTFTK